MAKPAVAKSLPIINGKLPPPHGVLLHEPWGAYVIIEKAESVGRVGAYHEDRTHLVRVGIGDLCTPLSSGDHNSCLLPPSVTVGGFTLCFRIRD